HGTIPPLSRWRSYFPSYGSQPLHPILIHQHVEVEEDFLVHGDFEFFAGETADVFDLPRALADEHALVTLVGGEDGGFDVDERLAGLVFAVFDGFNLDRGGVWDFLVGLEVKFFADEFGDPEFVGDVGDLTGGVLRRADRQVLEDG